MSEATVFLVDDNIEFRRSAAWWLTGEGYDVQVFDNAEQALNHLISPGTTARPACLLLDVRMPDMSGPDFHTRLIEQGVAKEKGGGLPIIYMTGHADVPVAVEAMQKGAVTFLEKPLCQEALLKALEQAFASTGHVNGSERDLEKTATAVAHGAENLESTNQESALTSMKMAANHEEGKQLYQERMRKLTLRENQVFKGLLASGTNKSIGRDLNISHRTVELHRGRLMEKMQADTFAHLLQMAVFQSVNVNMTETSKSN
jgi:FixJ family two-component response regulator